MTTAVLEQVPAAAEAHAALRADIIPTLGNNALTFTRSYQAYIDHPWGQHHALQPLRYPLHEYDNRAQKLRDLGNDVHPVGHMQVTHDDLVALVSSTIGVRGALDLSDPREIAVSRFSTLRHDCGESMHPEIAARCGGVIGDVIHGRKTPEDRKLEYTILNTVLLELDDNLPDWFRERALAVITHREESAAHIAYETAHDWGFYKTGLRAGRLALAIRDQPPTPRSRLLTDLAQTVTGKVRPQLEEAITNFPELEKRLELSEHLHDAIATKL